MLTVIIIIFPLVAAVVIPEHMWMLSVTILACSRIWIHLAIHEAEKEKGVK